MFSRNIQKIQELGNLPYFTIQDVADLLEINTESASVFCSRYAKQGLLVKLKNNLYTTTQNLQNISKKELLVIANRFQVPSYISLMTALSYFEITTQVQQNYIECISLKRSIVYEPSGIIFKYYRFPKKYYFDFDISDGIFIASKEKAFIDAVYLNSFGKYKFDKSSLDLNKLDKLKIKKIMKSYPEITKKIVRRLCRI
jgi:predicted transcriptional regulator of viral defense system